MRRLNRPIPLLTIAVALAGVTCSFPTDKSDKVFVTLEAPSGVVLRGHEMSVLARAYRVVGTDTQAIGNVDFAFYTTSSTLARVEPSGGGYATVTGVNSGTVEILARAVAFERAPQANLFLRISNPLEVDSVRPKVARHGQVITVYGVGVDSLFIASLAGVNLIEYPFSRVRDASGRGRISYWVPPPARSDSLFYLGAGVFGFDTATTTVVYKDIYEPNDTVPTVLDLNGPGPWPGTIYAPILFTNPALAFEPVDRAVGQGVDWFQFNVADTTRALTFFINYPSFGDTAATRTFLIDSLYHNVDFFGRDSADFIGSTFQRCRGFYFAPPQKARESTTVALRSLPSQHLHVVTFFKRAQRYGLTVLQGYFTADPRIHPDAYEENDMCHFADRPGKRITLAAGVAFTDTMTIDNPFDPDWYVVDVPPPAGVDNSFRIKLAPRPFATADSSDIDVYVIRYGDFALMASGVTKGSSYEDVSVSLAAGRYYVSVVDYAGVATRYSMCMSARGGLFTNNCNLIVAPSPPPPTASRLRPSASPRTLRGGTRPGPLFERGP